MAMNIKYYIATKEDKVGTVYSVAEYTNDQIYDVHTGKVDTNGIEALKEITIWLIDRDIAHNNNNEIQHHLSFKFSNVDDAVHIGNILDKEEKYITLRKSNYSFFASPAVFSNDHERMSLAKNNLKSYLMLRDYYIKQGKIH